jgi:hypothetical protein
VNAFEGGDHGIDVASTLDGSVDPTIGHLDKHLEIISEPSVFGTSLSM